MDAARAWHHNWGTGPPANVPEWLSRCILRRFWKGVWSIASSEVARSRYRIWQSRSEV